VGRSSPTYETTGVTRSGAQRTLERLAFRLGALVNSSGDAIISKDLNRVDQP
jgi:hypothetical protein